MKNYFVSKGRSVSDLKAHLVLTNKYRCQAITSEILKRLHVILKDLLVKWECKLVEFNGKTDHVHLLFQYHPDLQLSTLFGNIKSTTSCQLRQEFAEHLSRFYTKDVFWNGSYFIASCGGVTISTLKQYIEAHAEPGEWRFRTSCRYANIDKKALSNLRFDMVGCRFVTAQKFIPHRPLGRVWGFFLFQLNS